MIVVETIGGEFKWIVITFTIFQLMKFSLKYKLAERVYNKCLVILAQSWKYDWDMKFWKDANEAWLLAVITDNNTQAISNQNKA